MFGNKGNTCLMKMMPESDVGVIPFKFESKPWHALYSHQILHDYDGVTVYSEDIVIRAKVRDTDVTSRRQN